MDEETTNVLVVDDDPFVREMIEFILQDAGFHVDTAEDGEQALDKIRSDTDFHIVISDMHMPRMNGMELAAQIRKAGKTIPFLLLTGESGTSSSASLLSSDVKSDISAFLIKDESLQDLIVTSVRNVMKAKV
ncbi:MAG: response regulator [Nitrospirae bacterium]|nr:response regulator [Nitrospirota bacterium]